MYSNQIPSYNPSAAGTSVLSRLAQSNSQPSVEDLLTDPEFKSSFPALYAALVEESDFNNVIMAQAMKVGPGNFSGARSLPTATSNSNAPADREAKAGSQPPVSSSSTEKPWWSTLVAGPESTAAKDGPSSSASLPSSVPVLSSSVPVLPSSVPFVPSISTIQPTARQAVIAQSLMEAKANPVQTQPSEAPALAPQGATQFARRASISIEFPSLAWSSIAGREDVLVAEVKKQLAIAIPGLEEVAVRVEKQIVDPPSARSFVQLPAYRVDQVRQLFDDRRLLAATPLIAQGIFSTVPETTNEQEIGSVQARKEYSLEALERLEQLQQQYNETQHRRNLLESYHRIMAATDEAQARARSANFLGMQKIASADFAVGASFKQTDAIPFPYGGVPGVLSPRAKPVPEPELGSAPIEGPGNVRPVPPPAHLVFAKQGMDLTLQHMTSAAQRMMSQNAEIGRMLTEADEIREARRLVEAGIVSPATLDALLQSAAQKHEQARQLDEIKEQKAIEEERAAEIERENSTRWLKKIFAAATGDEDTELAMKGAKPPDELVKLKQAVKSEILGNKLASVHTMDYVKCTVTVERADNVPATLLLGGYSDSYVSIKVVGSTGTTINDSQTRPTAGSAEPDWSEALYFEISESPAPPQTVELALMAYNAVGKDSVLAKTSVDWEIFKKSTGETSCWVLRGEVDSDVFLFLKIDTGTELSPRKVKYAEPVGGEVVGEVVTRFPKALPGSLAAGRKRYWRYQKEQREQELEDQQAMGLRLE